MDFSLTKSNVLNRDCTVNIIHTLSGLGILSKSLPIFGDFLTKKVIGRLEALSEVVTSKLSGLSVACIMGKTSRL